MRQVQSSCIRFAALAFAFAAAVPLFAQFRQDPIYDQREITAPAAIKTYLAAQRKTIVSQKFHFTIGFTSAAEIGISKLCGTVILTDSSVVTRQNALAATLLAADEKALNENPSLRLTIPILKINPTPNMASLDWRKYGMVTPIKDQGWAGTCWAFGPIAALESSYLLLFNQHVDGSEQYIITNDTAAYGTPGNWNGGGYPWLALTYLTDKGTVSEQSDPYSLSAGSPNPNEFKPYGGHYWGFCHGSSGMATESEIKAALCAHGPVTTDVDAGGTWGYYTSGVYDDTSSDKSEGHCVTIIGWDDSKQAWLIKNSWGTNWGDTCGYGSQRGYMWLHYGVHQVGSNACWVHDHGTLNPPK